jgi:hypothetical protein
MLFNCRGEAGDGDPDPAPDPDLYPEPGSGDDNDPPPDLGDTPDPSPGEGGDDGDTAPDIGQLAQTVQTLAERLDTLAQTNIHQGRTHHQDQGNGDRPPSQDAAPAPKSRAEEARGARIEYDDTSHPYHGKTLGQIYDIDPSLAYQIDPYRAGIIQHDAMQREDTERQQQVAYRQQIEREEDDFRSELAKSEFNADLSTLTPEQRGKVDAELNRAEQWMIQNGKYGITITEAHYLMDRAGAAGRAASKVINDAQHGRVRSVSTKRDGGVDKSTANMASWDEATMEKYIDGLDSTGLTKFLSGAPEPVRKAFPTLPWS